MRPTDLAPKQILDELIRMYKADPYPAILVEADYPPFHCVMCYCSPKDIPCLAFTLYSRDHLNDITTAVRLGKYQTSGDIEESLNKFDKDCQTHAEVSVKILRVAVNSCLALAHYGCHMDYLFPKEIANDRKLAAEQTERGLRARGRLSLAVRVLSFDQEIRLHKTESVRKDGCPTGRVMTTCHWRKGHWAMQVHGPQHSLRKRIFRQPVLVRSDLFVGDLADTQTTYYTKKT